MKRIICLLLLALTLGGCAETELASNLVKQGVGNPNQGLFKVGKPYSVNGKTYVPRETYDYTETGIASWYGPGFDGKRTANGEVFDMNELTAAHRTLQMPSLVRVTNLENGRSLVVRVNDRGPFKRSRVIDVSKRAAELLGFRGNGTAKVRLDLLADESLKLAEAARRGEDTRGMEVAMNQTRSVPVQTAEAQPVSLHAQHGTLYPDAVVQQYPVRNTSIYIQLGSFSNPANAESIMERAQGFGPAIIQPAIIQNRRFFRVRLGPVLSVDQADTLLSRVIASGYKDSIIVVD